MSWPFDAVLFDGDFGLVIGVARSAAHDDLRSAGADIVVDDLGDLLP
jgi:hypothetical protein